MKCCLRLFITLWVVGFAENIVDTDIVESGKFDEDLSWNIICANFIFGISGLGHTQIVCKLFLTQIMICPKIPDTSINHPSSPKASISNLKWIIDF